MRWRTVRSAADMTVVYHRTLGGKVTFIDAMTRDEIEAAVERAPWEWSAEPRGFAEWPVDRVRGEPVELRSLADDARPFANSLWKRATA
jgi:hypothetical protein